MQLSKASANVVLIKLAENRLCPALHWAHGDYHLLSAHDRETTTKMEEKRLIIRYTQAQNWKFNESYLPFGIYCQLYLPIRSPLPSLSHLSTQYLCSYHHRWMLFIPRTKPSNDLATNWNVTSLFCCYSHNILMNIYAGTFLLSKALRNHIFIEYLTFILINQVLWTSQPKHFHVTQF